MIKSTSEVLDRHLKSFAECDLEAILADYSSAAVLFSPAGLLRGRDAMRPFFQKLITEFAKAGLLVDSAAARHRRRTRVYSLDGRNRG